MNRLKQFSNDGLTFDVVDAGPRDGPAIVLLHGWPNTSSVWDKVTPELNRAGFRTLAPDQRGYSAGARPRGRRAYRASKLVGDAVALLELVGGGHVVGHDWGAALSWMLAAERPDLVLSVTSVTVPHPGAMVRSWRKAEQVRKSWYMALFQMPFLPERALRTRAFETMLRKGGMSAEMTRRYRAEIVEDGAQTGGLNWYRALPFADPRMLKRKVSVPATHVWASDDVALGRHGAELCGQYVEGAPYELVVLEGASHWVPDEEPERLAEIILARTGPARPQ